MELHDEAFFRKHADPACIQLLADYGPELDANPDVSALRAMGQQALEAVGPAPIPAGVRLELRDGPAGTTWRVFLPETRALPTTAILWIHGGGLIAGVPEQDDLLCANMALGHGCPVVATSYGLAPEAPFPRGLEDCFASLEALAASDLGADRVLLAGASAGGCLALATALLARDRGLDLLCGLYLQYPMLDDREGRASMDSTVYRKTWHRDMNVMAWRAYLAGTDQISYLAVPGRASCEELRELPPTFIDVGTLDAFYDEDVALTLRLAEAHVPVELLLTPGAFHASEVLAPQSPTSTRILAARAGARQRMLDGVAG